MRLKDNIRVGVVAGVIGTVIGVVLYYVYLRYIAESVASNTGIPGVPLFDFIKDMWGGGYLHMVLSIGCIFNLLVFFIFVWTKRWRTAYGVIYATMGWLVLLLAMAFLL